jgi:hypothetical protein
VVSTQSTTRYRKGVFFFFFFLGENTGILDIKTTLHLHSDSPEIKTSCDRVDAIHGI